MSKSREKVDRSKSLPIFVLFATSVLIIGFGAIFSIASFLGDISLPVMGTDIHGAIFGLAIVFLGIRYFAAVQRLKSEVYKSTSQFSFSNFRRQKKTRQTRL